MKPQPPTFESLCDLTIVERHEILTEWTNTLCDSYERIAAQRDALLAACERLMMEAIHYRDTGRGADILNSAIGQASAAIATASQSAGERE